MLRRIAAEILHQLADFSQTVLAFQRAGRQRFAVIPKLRVQLPQHVDQRFALALVISRGLADQSRRHYRVFVASIIAGQISIAFLIAEQISIVLRFFELVHFFADIFETGQRIKHRCSVMAGNRRTEFAGDDRFDDRPVRRKRTGCFHLA